MADVFGRRFLETGASQAGDVIQSFLQTMGAPPKQLPDPGRQFLADPYNLPMPVGQPRVPLDPGGMTPPATPNPYDRATDMFMAPQRSNATVMRNGPHFWTPLDVKPKPGGANGSVVTGGGGLDDELMTLTAENARATGVDQRVWNAAILAESGGNRTARNPGSGARGILQHMPGIWSPNNPERLDDPKYSLELARDRFTQAWNNEAEARKHGWNFSDPVERAVWTISRGQVYESSSGDLSPAFRNPNAPTNERVRKIVKEQWNYPTYQSNTEGQYRQTPVLGAAAEGAVNQYKLGLSQDIADAFCGPAAAKWFVRHVGRNPDAMETLNLAKEVGWTRDGMNGPERAVNLIRRLGGDAELVWNVDWQRVAGEVLAGRPVIIDTEGHYFQVTGYNANDGSFNFGESATILRASGGNGWATPQNFRKYGMGPARAAIYMR